jgi:predicted transcriptional regulator
LTASSLKRIPRPTDAELAILQILWNRGPSTVREVHSELGRRRRVGYTTVLKLLQIMAEKGLVQRDERARAHIYRARVARNDTERRLVGELVERAFQGSAGRLALRALATRRASAEEIERIRRLLDELEGGEE